eukprot:scaffold17228_cov49-Cyclotella_meneghiniana.AAC.5
MATSDSSFKSAQALCYNEGDLSESVLVSQLEAILKKSPQVVHEHDDCGDLLFHHAARRRSPEFCRLFVDIDPDLVKSASDYGDGRLPLHLACATGNIETAKYLYHNYPESINIPDGGGRYPIHWLMDHTQNILPRNEQSEIDLTRILLEHDQGAVSKLDYMYLPLHYACGVQSLPVVKLVFDAYPKAIHPIRRRFEITVFDFVENRMDKNEERELVSFFEHQINLERQAREDTTPDNHGRLPIHRALQSRDMAVGGIKLMVAANPASIGVTDNQGCSLLHIACQGGNVDTVKYIVGLDKDSLNLPDLSGNLPLHHACMGGNCDVISHIIEQSTFGATLQNSDKQIPIQLLLFESECDRDSMEYVEAVRCLFQVNPVDTLKCLTGKDKSDTDNDGVDQGTDRKRKRM